MPQIIFLIIALIIKVAIDSNKDEKRHKSYNDYKYKRTKISNSRVSGGADVFSDPNAAIHATTEKTMARQPNIMMNRSRDPYTNTHEQLDVNKGIEDKYVPEEQDIERKDTLSSIEEIQAQARQEALDEIDFIQAKTNIDMSEIRKEYQEENNTYLYDVPQTNNPKLEFNRIKLMILTMIYVMYEDDGELTRKEKKQINQIIKVSVLRLDRKSANEIKKLIDVRPNLDMIFDRAYEWGLTANDVFDASQKIRKSVKRKEYQRVFKRIEDRVTFEV